jgi:hypothetical protein
MTYPNFRLRAMKGLLSPARPDATRLRPSGPAAMVLPGQAAGRTLPRRANLR